MERASAKPSQSSFSWFRELSGQIWEGFLLKGVAPRNIEMTRKAYKLEAVLIKTNSEAEVS